MANPEPVGSMEGGFQDMRRRGGHPGFVRLQAVGGSSGAAAGESIHERSPWSGAVSGEGLAAGWGWDEMAGRLMEFSGAPGASGVLSAAMRWVAEAQRRGEPVAWVTSQESSFFPPDAAEGGIDLQSLVVVRVPEMAEVARAAESLARSGAFGLVVLDLVPSSSGTSRVANPAPPLLNRLQGVARAHETLILFMTEKAEEELSVGPLVSLRAEVSIGNRCEDSGDFWLHSRVIKNKCGPPGSVVCGLFSAPCGI